MVTTITKEISTEQVRSLDLHQGDSLRVVAEVGETLVVQIVKAVTPDSNPNLRGKAGEWSRKYAGAVKGNESADDLRISHYREKYGI